jgi:hypothetical protein
MRQLVGPCVSFLNMPLVTYAAVEGVQIRQPAKSRCSAEKLHQPSAPVATRRFKREHGTISNVSAKPCGVRALPPRGRKLNFWQDFVRSIARRQTHARACQHVPTMSAQGSCSLFLRIRRVDSSGVSSCGNSYSSRSWCPIAICISRRKASAHLGMLAVRC